MTFSKGGQYVATILARVIITVFIALLIFSALTFAIAFVDLIIVTKKDWEEYNHDKTNRRNGRKTGKED